MTKLSLTKKVRPSHSLNTSLLKKSNWSLLAARMVSKINVSTASFFPRNDGFPTALTGTAQAALPNCNYQINKAQAGKTYALCTHNKKKMKWTMQYSFFTNFALPCPPPLSWLKNTNLPRTLTFPLKPSKTSIDSQCYKQLVY